MTKQMIFRTKSLSLGALFLALLVTQPLLATNGQVTNRQASNEPLAAPVRRPDPSSGTLVSVDAQQIKPGKIYNFFSQLHGRYVWGYAKKGGGFSYALGMGSTELPSHFDLVTTPSKTKELIEAEAGPWAERSRQLGSQILVRLGEDEKWKIVRGRTIRSHYDIDSGDINSGDINSGNIDSGDINSRSINSGRRWEWHGNRKVAVLHSNGYLWQYSDHWYTPANPWLVSVNQLGSH